jgi:hypothetical protein
LVRIVTLETIGFAERLAVMRFDEPFVLHIVTVETKGRRRFGQVKLSRGIFTIFVIDVAAIASEIERGVPAAFFRHFHAGVVAGQAKIFLSFAGGRLQQLILVIRAVRVVTTNAVANSGAVDTSLDLGRIFVCMTLKA